MQATLIQLTASKRQRLTAGVAAAVLLCAMLLVWPYATVQGSTIEPFMPVFSTSVVFAEGLTAYLLATQYRVSGRPVFAVLASGYAFTSVAAAVHLAVYPGVFAPTGLLHAGRQTAIWIWLLWRGAFALFVMLALAIRSRPPIASHDGRRSRGALAMAGAIALSSALCWAAIAAHDRLPNLVASAGPYRHLTANPAIVSVVLTCIAALAVYAYVTRLRTLMDLWLAFALLAGIGDIVLTLGAGARYSIGWYAARIASMVSANALLGMLVSETSRTYLSLADAHRTLQALSVRDGLTGVFNRAYFDERYPRELALARAAGYPVSILLVDVDHFKDYNDAFGHLAGDECLRRIAHALAASLTRQTDFVARYGGEEFVVMLPACDPRVGASTAERLRQAVADMKLPGPSEKTPYVTISIGHASSRSHADLQGATLLASADAALYAAKASGRNRVEHEQAG
ncbi:MAG TPA: sensor domain-containing diguanylate cyclase [Trinickia sp.]|nr:sensor domain-containing diguanylate cyclase [Trinickia sp.]